MEDLRLKRRLIEVGHLNDWSRRGHSKRIETAGFIKKLLRFGLDVTGLDQRGKRNALNPVVEHLRFEFDHLPTKFEGFRILHLSDIHADGLEELADVLYEALNRLHVDVCVLTGDYRFALQGMCHRVYPNMARILDGVNSQHGIIGVLGNHDAEEMVSEFERMGIRVLMNEAHPIHSVDRAEALWFVGLDDPHYYGCDDLPGALQQVPDDAFKVLLVHTPEVFDDAHHHGIQLYLCGHTHGGQIRLPFIGPVLTHANAPRRFASGAWRYKTVQGYTSSGVGCSGVAARFLCPPEIVLIELSQSRSTNSSGGAAEQADTMGDKMSLSSC